ncbi:SAM-dependent methyltransferase [Treponema parvum]|uniref:SAM-dependent methyltransferase n=1 Tax=Treponema parvum TaxID=138851 RepID=A0A975ID73_9SPIR|nr:SAM-dependent methyltransferase [Treponema parvum]QTQ12736.1 SAM-dependent methyltransferase [Treponema parvum]
MSCRTEKLSGAALLAFHGTEGLFLEELRDRLGIKRPPDAAYGDLLYFSDWPAGSLPYWCRTAMTEPFLLHFDSCKEAANSLKEIQRNWAPYTYRLFRRSNFIQESLPYINLKPKKFPFCIPKSPIGLYTLIDEHTIIASAKTTSFLPAGTINFEENHKDPPSRAYLKLQEALCAADCLLGTGFPKAKDRCLDAGASPGGWTWVLAELGCDVLAVDRAELAPGLMKDPLVKFIKHDAFTLKPEELGAFDWVFSDVICYPERLYKWVQGWVESGLAKNMICTIKMKIKTETQDKIDWNLIKEFENLPESRIVHLNYNKHELTWLHRSGKT